MCGEFRKLGFDAYSCDIKPTSGNHPEWHIQCDVRDILNDPWDMIIAHPPCTYMCIGSAVRMFPKGILSESRYQSALAAKDFFNLFFYHSCSHVCIENPVPLKVVGLPKPDQVIQPYMFGDPYSKKTCLWLKGLPQLLPNVFFCAHTPYIGSSKNRGAPGIAHTSEMRSKTFPGIAAQMALQWSEVLM